MKAAIGIVVGAAILALTGAPVYASQTKQDASTITANDKMMDERIERRLKGDGSLKKFDIDVSVNAGVATLTGKVATNAQKARAERLAQVTGITRVDNQIVVDPSAGKGVKGTTGTIKETAKEGVEKTKEGAEKVIDKTKEGLSKTGEVITDTWITGRVKTSFMGEDALKGSDINVDTNDHIVTLRGTVTSEAGRARAIELAKKVEGVRNVVDRLTIGPKK